MPRVRTVRRGRESDETWHELWIGDQAYDRTDWDGWLVLRHHLANATATDLAHWMEAADCGEILLSDQPESMFDPDYGPAIDIAFELRHGKLELRLELTLGEHFHEFGDDDALLDEMRRLLGAALISKRMTLDEIEWRSAGVATAWVGFSKRARRLGDLVSAAEGLLALIRAVEGGALTRTDARDLVLAGHLDVLIGQPEGVWLDAKVQLYDTADPAGKLSLVQSVAAFANGPYGGLIVFGLGTKKSDGGEVITTFRPVPATPATAVRYHKVIDRNLFPPPVGLRVFSVSGPGGNYLLIDVPPQVEELKPFLVHGAIVGGKYRGSFISIVTRRDEGSIPTTAEGIHATLAAGRALMRGTRQGFQLRDEG